jgi:peptidoglycan/xylan/chitin deacetylase (PgdA/CDA1 family)
MDRTRLQAWIDAGQEIGSHASNHVDLTVCDPQRRASEIARIAPPAGGFGAPAGWRAERFCYPYGRFDRVHVWKQPARSKRDPPGATTRPGGVAFWSPSRTAPSRYPRVLISRSTSWVQPAS